MPQREVHLRDYLEILQKYDFVICLSFLLISGTALIVSLRLPKTYAASSLILFIQPSSNPPVSSTSLFQSVLSGGVDRSEMETIGQRFSTESMLVPSIGKLESANIAGVRYLPSIPSLKRHLKAKIRPDTHYIELSLCLRESDGGERNAALLINQLVVEMQALRSREEQAKGDRRRKLLDEKLMDLLQQVKTQEETARQFVRGHGSPSTWYPRLSSLLEQRVRLQDKQIQLQQAIEGAQLELNYLHKEIESTPEYVKTSETIRHDPIWLHQTEKLIDLESQRVGLDHQIGKNSPEIKALNAQIENIETQLKEFTENQEVTSITQGPSAFYAGIQERLIGLRTVILRTENNLTQIKPELEQINRELRELVADIPENEMILEKLQREIDVIHELKKEIYKQSLEAEILLAESNHPRSELGRRRIRGGIEVVDPAVPRKIPVSPRIKVVVVIAGVVGCTVSISVALLIEYFGNAYRHPEDVQSELGLLYLGTVKKREGQDRLPPAMSEDYRTTAANIDLSHPELKKQVIMLTSCDLGSEGISTVTANLGTTLVSVKEAVLIVDCNLSQPTQHQIFNISPEAVRADLRVDDQIDWARAIQHTSIPNLNLLSPGLLSSNPIDFLRLSHLQTFFQQLRHRYELILIDAPPVLIGADSLILSVHCDAVVLIIDLDQTTRETLRMCRDRLVNARIPVLGFIEI